MWQIEQGISGTRYTLTCKPKWTHLIYILSQRARAAFSFKWNAQAKKCLKWTGTHWHRKQTCRTLEEALALTLQSRQRARPAFLTKPSSAKQREHSSQQKHCGCQLQFIAFITRPVMNASQRLQHGANSVLKSSSQYFLPSNYIHKCNTWQFISYIVGFQIINKEKKSLNSAFKIALKDST